MEGLGAFKPLGTHARMQQRLRHLHRCPPPTRCLRARSCQVRACRHISWLAVGLLGRLMISLGDGSRRWVIPGYPRYPRVSQGVLLWVPGVRLVSGDQARGTHVRGGVHETTQAAIFAWFWGINLIHRSTA